MLAYSSGNFGKALLFSGADLTILFLLTDVLGLGATTAGLMMLVALCGPCTTPWCISSQNVLFSRASG